MFKTHPNPFFHGFERFEGDEEVKDSILGKWVVKKSISGDWVFEKADGIDSILAIEGFVMTRKTRNRWEGSSLLLLSNLR